MKASSSKTTVPDGPASDQDEQAVGQADNSKGFFGFVYDSLRKMIAEGHDLYVSESTGVGPLNRDSPEGVGGNEVKESSLPHEICAPVTATSSRGSGLEGLGTGPACPSQPPEVSIDTGLPHSELPTLPPPTAATVSPSPDVDHAAAASVPSLSHAHHESATPTNALTSSNELHPTFATTFLESAALPESTRSLCESGCTGQLSCNAEASTTNNFAAGRSLPQVPSALAASLPPPRSNEHGVLSATRHVPGPANANAASFQPNLPVHPLLATSQGATVAYPSVDATVYPVASAPAPVAYLTYAHPQPTQPVPPSPFNAHPSFNGHLGNSLATPAWHMNTPYHESSPISVPYYSPTVSSESASSALYWSSLRTRHYNEPDCVAAIERLQEIDAVVASVAAAGRMPMEWYGHGHLEDMEPTRQRRAAYQVLADCENRRRAEFERQIMEDGLRRMVEFKRQLARIRRDEEQKMKMKMKDLKRDCSAMFEQAFGHSRAACGDAAVVAWLQDTERAMALNDPAEEDDASGHGNNALGLYNAA